MNSNYFSNCATVDEIKAEYRRLAKKHHPDVNPDDPTATKTMQDINAAYFEALKANDGKTTQGSDDQPHTYHYNEEHEQAIADKIAELLGLDLPEAARVLLIGKWVWVEGLTREDKAAQKLLSSAGLRFHGKRTAWYWKPYAWSGRRNYKATDTSDIKARYGSEQFKRKPKQAARAMATA